MGDRCGGPLRSERVASNGTVQLSTAATNIRNTRDQSFDGSDAAGRLESTRSAAHHTNS